MSSRLSLGMIEEVRWPGAWWPGVAGATWARLSRCFVFDSITRNQTLSGDGWEYEANEPRPPRRLELFMISTVLLTQSAYCIHLFFYITNCL